MPPGSVKCSWKQLGRGAELLIMHSSKNELWRVWVNFNIFQLNGSSSSYRLLPPDLAAGQDPQRSLQISITACWFSYIFKQALEILVWDGVGRKSVPACFNMFQQPTKTYKDKNNENDSGMPSPWIPLAIATNVHCQAAGRRCAWSYDNLGAKTSRGIKASCPAFELQALGHSRSIIGKQPKFCMCVQFFFVRSLRMLQVVKKTVL